MTLVKLLALTAAGVAIFRYASRPLVVVQEKPEGLKVMEFIVNEAVNGYSRN